MTASVPRIALYQPLYEAGQRPTEPAFLPYRLADNSHADWREFWIFVDMYRRGVHRGAAYTGLVSPKFASKTGLSGAGALAFVDEHPGADVYLFTSDPQLPYISYNVWRHGEYNHPGITARTQGLLDACNIGWDLSAEGRHAPAICCYSNYWVGSTRFWERYVGAVLAPMADLIEMQPDHPVVRAVFEPTDYEVEAPFLPFLGERLLTTFLAHSPDLRIVPRLWDPVEAAVYPFRRDLVGGVRAMIDAADALETFPPETRDLLDLFTRLVTAYEEIYFLDAPRPQSGRVVPLRRSQRDAAGPTSHGGE